jgi:hypothetical protein
MFALLIALPIMLHSPGLGEAGCSAWYERAVQLWTSRFGGAIFWDGEDGYTLPRAGVPYPFAFYCLKDDEGRVKEVLGVHEPVPPHEYPAGQQNTRWVLEMICPDAPLDQCQRVGRPRLYFVDTFSTPSLLRRMA